MQERKVWVFFYGSFINLEVLATAGLIPEQLEVACLWGYDIRIQPLANLIPSQRHCVYGIVCQASPRDLLALYGQTWVGTYWPEAVLVECEGGSIRPALCYISPPRPVEAATSDYIDRIAKPAREYGFPSWYIERIELFRHGPLLEGEPV